MKLNESISDTLIVYLILKKLIKPFNEWEAYKLGIIDENGKKLKQPKTRKEKDAWNILTIFIWNIKKLIHKFLGKSKVATYLSASYLLKDSFKLMYRYNSNLLTEEDMEIINNIKAIDKLIIMESIKRIKNQQSYIITESKIETDLDEIETRFIEIFIEFYKTLEKGNETMIKLKEMVENLITETHYGNNAATVGDTSTDNVFDEIYLKDPYIMSFNKTPQKSMNDIRKFDREHSKEDVFQNNVKFFQRWEKDAVGDFSKVFDKMGKENIKYDSVMKKLPVFDVASQDEFDSFGQGMKLKFRWLQHTKNENVRQFALKFPKMPFFIHYNGQYKLIQRGKPEALYFTKKEK